MPIGMGIGIDIMMVVRVNIEWEYARETGNPSNVPALACQRAHGDACDPSMTSSKSIVSTRASRATSSFETSNRFRRRE
jgi:hypothetical protein